ncbi:serine/threonine-protein phosphatase 6 regulatory ankyrin repeat subunit B [Microdochium nivale]|nr:serine/threonine-protein phosphatase 6 regulatory ankyrin repeat subunit B [Microdochium nivale]
MVTALCSLGCCRCSCLPRPTRSDVVIRKHSFPAALLSAGSRWKHLDLHDVAAFCAIDRVHHALSPILVHKPLVPAYPHLLTWAAHTGLASLARDLLAAGADPNVNFRRWAVIDRDFASPRDTLNKLYHHAFWSRHYKQNGPAELGEPVLIRTALNAKEQATSGTLSRRPDLRKKTADIFAELYSNHFVGQAYRGSCLVGEPFEPANWNLARWQQPDLNNHSWWSPLHAAASAGHNDLVLLLVKHGAHLDAPAVGLCDCTHPCSPVSLEPQEHIDWQCQVCWSPLHLAMCGGHDTTAQLLLSLGASTCVDRLQSSPTALFSAARYGCAGTVRQLLASDETRVNSRDHHGLTPLFHYLVGSHGSHPHDRREQVARILLEHGADPDVDLGDGCSLLHAACYYGWPSTAQEIVVAQSTDLGRVWRGIPGFSHLTFRPLELLAWLTAEYDVQNHEHFRGHTLGTTAPDDVRDLVQGVDIDHSQAQDEACIELRAHRNDLMQLLLARSGHAFTRPHRRSTYTPLIAAIAVGSRERVQKLVDEFGASVLDASANGTFPLLAAVSLRQKFPARLGYMQPTFSMDQAETQSSVYLKIVKFLLDRGAKVNQSGHRGATALLAACRARKGTLGYFGGLPIITSLLAAGADIHMSDSSGIQPLDAAMLAQNHAIAAKLIQAGAELDPESQMLVGFAKEVLYKAESKMTPCVEESCTCKPALHCFHVLDLATVFQHLLRCDRRRSILADSSCFWLASRCPFGPFAKLMFAHGRPNVSERGCLLNLVRAFSQTCEASHSTILPLIPLLRESGADFDLASPIWHALSNNKWTVAKALLKNGARMTRPYLCHPDAELQGDVILLLIRGEYSAEAYDIIRLILTRIEPRFTKSELNVYLYEACEYFHPTIVNLLLVAGAEWDAAPPPANLYGDAWPADSTPALVAHRSWLQGSMAEDTPSTSAVLRFKTTLSLLRPARSGTVQ